MRKDFNYLCHVNVEEWYKLLIHFCISYEKFSTWGVRYYFMWLQYKRRVAQDKRRTKFHNLIMMELHTMLICLWIPYNKCCACNGCTDHIVIMFQIVSHSNKLVDIQREQEKVLEVAAKLVYKNTLKVHTCTPPWQKNLLPLNQRGGNTRKGPRVWPTTRAIHRHCHIPNCYKVVKLWFLFIQAYCSVAIT